MYSQSSDLRLFVAGIPSQVWASSVESYFAQFGRVRVKSLPQDKFSLEEVATTDCLLSKGFCILVLDCQQTLQNILTAPAHYFQGRTLQVSEYREGIDLTRHNQKLNRRRVVVKKVPKHWTEEYLLSLLSVYGPVQSIYRYKAQCPGSQATRERRQPTQTFSVVFAERLAALAATREPTPEIKNAQVVIEKFDRKLNTIEGAYSPLSEQNFTLSLYLLHQAALITQLFPENAPNTEQTLVTTTTPQPSKPSQTDSLPISSPAQSKSPSQSSSFLTSDSVSTYHTMKPTSMTYHESRSSCGRNIPLLSPMQGSVAFNLRFNCEAKKPEVQTLGGVPPTDLTLL